MPETFGLNDFAYLLLLAIIEKLNGLPDGLRALDRATGAARRAAPVAFLRAREMATSVVLVVSIRLALTRACLESLAATSSAFDVCVVPPSHVRDPWARVYDRLGGRTSRRSGATA